MRVYLISVIILIQFGCAGGKKGGFPDGKNELEKLLRAAYTSGNLNGNILVVRKGETLYEGSFGFADAAKKTPLTSAHRFGFGSIYKEFPAAAIMQLKNAGKISLDDRVGKYLPGLPAWSDDVSIRQLLFYTAGLPPVDWNSLFASGKEVTGRTLLNEITSMTQLEFAPGTGYSYTNYAPFLLIKVVEKVTGQPFGEYASKHLFIPASMRSIVMPEGYPYPAGDSLMAIPFSEDYEADDYALSGVSLLYCATAQDLLAWVEALHGGDILPSEDLLVLAPTADPENENQQSPLGNCQMKNNEITEHIHHGSMGNYEALIHRNNEEDLTIILLTNQKHYNVYELAEAIQATVLNQKI